MCAFWHKVKMFFIRHTLTLVYTKFKMCELVKKQTHRITYTVSYQSISLRVTLHSVSYCVEQNYNKYMSLNLMHYLWKVLSYKAVCFGIFTLPPIGRNCYTHMFDAECGWGNRNLKVPDTNIVNARILKVNCDTHHQNTKCSLCIKNPLLKSSS